MCVCTGLVGIIVHQCAKLEYTPTGIISSHTWALIIFNKLLALNGAESPGACLFTISGNKWEVLSPCLWSQMCPEQEEKVHGSTP